MRKGLANLHPLMMIPLVSLIWFGGVTVVLAILSAIDVPGVNEHGPGTLYVLGAIGIATVGSLAQIVIVIVRRYRGAPKMDRSPRASPSGGASG